MARDSALELGLSGAAIAESFDWQENAQVAKAIFDRQQAVTKAGLEDVARRIRGTGLNAFSGLYGWPYRP